MSGGSSERHSPCRVLITRPRDQAQEFANLLRKGGMETLLFPTIEIVPPDVWTTCDEHIRRIEEYTDIIFTSSNAVRFFLERCASFFDPARLRRHTFHAVGPKTQEAIAAFGFSAAPLPENFDARHLAERIGSDPTARERRFLFPKGELAEETLVRRLREMGLSVEAVTVYRTVKPNPPREERDAVWTALVRGEICAVTFFSPSSARNFVDFFPDFPALCRDALGGGAGHGHSLRIAVVGQTTARACQELGLPVHLCPKGKDESSPTEALARILLRELREVGAR